MNIKITASKNGKSEIPEWKLKRVQRDVSSRKNFRTGNYDFNLGSTEISKKHVQKVEKFDGKRWRKASEDIDAPLLTSMIGGCTSFSQVMYLFNGQNEKPYFNAIHMTAIFSYMIKALIEGETTIDTALLNRFKAKLIALVKTFNDRTIANVAHSAEALLEYGKQIDNQCLLEIATSIIDEVFEEVFRRGSKALREFPIEALCSIAKCASNLHKYGRKRQKETLNFSAVELLRCVFHEILHRHRMGEQFDSRAKNNLSCYAKEMLTASNEQEFQCLAKITLQALFENIQNGRKDWHSWNAQDLSTLSSNAACALHWCNNQSYEMFESLLAQTLRDLFIHIKYELKGLSDFNAYDIKCLAYSVEVFFHYAKKKRDISLASDLFDIIFRAIENKKILSLVNSRD